MPDNNATILIPDISGFTEFMTSTELDHGSNAINMLIDAIVDAVGDAYEVSEIEGDAVLLIRKGSAPAKKDIKDICLKIFTAFHLQRGWLQQHAICPCMACRSLGNLTLKFVVHHGPLAEIRVGRFVKHAGAEMIVAHRLLKNSINNHEYLLVSEKLLQEMPDASATVEMEWTSSFDEYDSIGKIDYSFASLNDARKNVQLPPLAENYATDDTPYYEVPIAGNFRDVYSCVMSIADRADWVPGLISVEQEIPIAYIGSVHRCTFEDAVVIVSPIKWTSTNNTILYAESWQTEDENISLVQEYVFKKADDQACLFACRFMNAGTEPLADDIYEKLLSKMKMMVTCLKHYCEK